ncbi:GH25 family lysozyme [Anaerotruncus colihominis]|uniref:GH25 family lysozyme n=1 Tax=Anaerotruncus colihominis TaxID=169435 RepID=UPI001FACC162|nr:GH25 family lysozyme [Anaerotruncus colihominis]
MEIKGIDISSHQGETDFERVKAASVRFVIIKARQGLWEMGTFHQKYLPAVLAMELDWGAYWWSDAVDYQNKPAQGLGKYGYARRVLAQSKQPRYAQPDRLRIAGLLLHKGAGNSNDMLKIAATQTIC